MTKRTRRKGEEGIDEKLASQQSYSRSEGIRRKREKGKGTGVKRNGKDGDDEVGRGGGGTMGDEENCERLAHK